MRFEGKRAVVTGAASGIGRATALRLANEGAFVLVGDIDEAGGAALAEMSGGQIAFQRCDVTDAGQIESLMATADAGGGLDLLVNNAGAGGARGKIAELSPEDWDRTQSLLLRSVAMGIRYAAPLIGKRGGGAREVGRTEPFVLVEQPTEASAIVAVVVVRGIVEERYFGTADDRAEFGAAPVEQGADNRDAVDFGAGADTGEAG